MPAAQNFKAQSSDLPQKGQGIIEIVVVVGLSALIILALVVLSVRSNTNATASSAEDQAARFAQQGLEVIRSARIGNTTKLFYGGSLISWQDFYSTLPPPNGVTPETDTYGQAGHIEDPVMVHSLPTCPASNWCVIFNSGDTGRAVTGYTRFTRTIYVSDSPAKSKCNTATDFTDVKQFTVKVTWTDSAGPHNSTATSCITRTDSSTSS